jgi:exocyst complex component 4
VDLALQLLGESGQGKDIESFRRTKNMLGRALKGSVDSGSYISLSLGAFVYSIRSEHYQAFAASLPHQATLTNHLTEAQTQIQAARASLLESKDALGNKRADLVQLWSRGQTLDEMLRILDEMYVQVTNFLLLHMTDSTIVSI